MAVIPSLAISLSLRNSVSGGCTALAIGVMKKKKAGQWVYADGAKQGRLCEGGFHPRRGGWD